MTEQEMALTAEQPMEVDPQAVRANRIRAYRRGFVRTVGSAMALTVALAACGSDGGTKLPEANSASTPTTIELTPAQAHEAADLCPTGFNMAGNKADNLKYVGSAESFYPAVSSVNDKGETVLNSKEKARVSILDTLCRDSRSLAVFTAFVTEPADTYHLPDEKSLGRVKTLEKLYESNDQAALADLKKAAHRLEFIDPTNDFVTITGEATQVTPVRDGEGAITGAKTVRPKTNGRLQGFEIGFDKVNPNLTDDQKNVLNQLKNLILIDEKGRLVIKVWIGEGQINLPEQGKSNKNNNQSNANNNNGGNQNGNNQGNQGTGGSAGPNGHNPEAGPNGSTNSPANGGGNRGPRGTTGTTTGTTPGTTGSSTTTRPVTTTTRPVTTTTRPVVTTTTVPTTKGTVPCDPNVSKC